MVNISLLSTKEKEMLEEERKARLKAARKNAKIRKAERRRRQVERKKKLSISGRNAIDIQEHTDMKKIATLDDMIIIKERMELKEEEEQNRKEREIAEKKDEKLTETTQERETKKMYEYENIESKYSDPLEYLSRLPDQEKEMYDNLSTFSNDSDDDSVAVAAIFTVGRCLKKGNFRQYLGPFSVDINMTKLQRRKSSISSRIRIKSVWKPCFMYYYPQSGTILLHFKTAGSGGTMTKMLEFSAVDSDNPTTIKDTSVYDRKPHTLHISNIRAYHDIDQNRNPSFKDLILKFLSEEERSTFVEVIQDTVVFEHEKNVMMAELVCERDI